MKYSEKDHNQINEKLCDEWIRRSKSQIIRRLGPGCFIYDTNKNDHSSSGMFYKLDMLPKYFPAEVAADLQKMINEISSPNEVVAAVIFEDKMVGARLGTHRKQT